MARGRKKKDPFADLSTETRDAIAQSTDEEIKERIVKIAQAEADNLRMKAEDLHLAEAKAAYDDAGAVYREASKSHALETAFCLRVLRDRKEA